MLVLGVKMMGQTSPVRCWPAFFAKFRDIFFFILFSGKAGAIGPRFRGFIFLVEMKKFNENSFVCALFCEKSRFLCKMYLQRKCPRKKVLCIIVYIMLVVLIQVYIHLSTHHYIRILVCLFFLITTIGPSRKNSILGLFST